MFLKSIKLAGFKSFVDPTLANLNPKVNAIVGPNGCGKSNIVDAIRWVIGEISAKQLRGQSMSDVIFAGSNKRKPVGKAAVELVFDNTSRRLVGEYAAFTEISIRREVVRDGGSQYFINGVQCRRRDILDLFLGTGLGAKRYSIIEQGMISSLIEAKPHELRGHIEELAGISKYQARRDDTHRRMEKTEENLARLNDLRQEIEKRLRHLQRQAKSAEKFQVYQAERTQLAAEIDVQHWQMLSAVVDEKEAEVLSLQVVREEVLAAQRTLEEQVEQTRQQQDEQQALHQQKQKQYYDITTTVSELEQKQQQLNNQLQQDQRRLQSVSQREENIAEQLFSYDEDLCALRSELEELLPQKEDLSAQTTEAAASLNQAKAAQAAWQQEWDTYQQRTTSLSATVEAERAKQLYLQDKIHENQQRAVLLQSAIAENDLSDLEAEQAPLAEALRLSSEQYEQAQQAADACQESVKQLRQSVQQHSEALRQADKDRLSCASKLVAEEARQAAALQNSDQHVKSWLKSQSLQNNQRLAENIQVTAGWEAAIETLMKSQLQAVCVDDLQPHVHQGSALQSGEILLITRSAEQSAPICDKPWRQCASLVTSDWPLSPWLDHVYAADSMAEVEEWMPALAAHESIITRDGQWFAAGWMRLQQPTKEADSVIKREQRIQDLREQHTAAEAQCAELTEQLNSARAAVTEQEQATSQHQQAIRDAAHQQQQAQRAHDNCLRDLQVKQRESERCIEEHTSSQRVVSESESALASLQQQCEANVVALAEHDAQRDGYLAQRSQLADTLAQAQSLSASMFQRGEAIAVKVSACESQITLLEQSQSRDSEQQFVLQEERDSLNERITTAEAALPEVAEALTHALQERMQAESAMQEESDELNAQRQLAHSHDNQRRDLQKRLDDLQAALTEQQLAAQDAKTRRATLDEKMQAEEINIASILEQFDDALTVAERESRLEGLDNKITRLGAINMAAISECQEAEERQTYLETQHDDLTESLRLLQTAIRKIDDETKSLFKDTYDKVNAFFQNIFPKVFRGGRATLETTEDDWLTTGITVKAQPPGKRNSSIHMLSGGEKALTALSLVFAMFEINSAPFCILDEVDAPLDDFNVGRFCDLVRAMSEKTQFLMISHNKLTIQMADQMMGITMQEPGVSRVVSVDMAQAIEMVEASV